MLMQEQALAFTVVRTYDGEAVLFFRLDDLEGSMPAMSQSHALLA